MTLDKLTEDERFHEAYPTLVPGSDLTIRFRAISANDMIDEGSAEPVVTNSLFASVQSGTAEITYGRHLQNLDESSGINANKEKLEITKAVQRSHLHLRTMRTMTRTGILCTVRRPTSRSITVADAHDGSYQLSGSGTAAEAGALCDLRIADRQRHVRHLLRLQTARCHALGAAITGGDRARALAATISNKSDTTEVQGCRVYLSAAEGDLTDKTEKDVRIKGSQYVGGLVGYAACKLQISDSCPQPSSDSKQAKRSAVWSAMRTIPFKSAAPTRTATSTDRTSAA